MKVFSQIKYWLLEKSLPKQQAFTLPEVIVSFSILVMVITSATGILVTVIRTNADNVSNLTANGLAQEGIDAIRFVRDSDKVLGLQFNANVKNSSKMLWGEELFDMVSPEAKNLSLEVKNAEDVQAPVNCKTAKTFDGSCLPIQLHLLDVNTDSLAVSDSTIVYKKTSDDSNKDLIYFQRADASSDATMTATQYHRYIHIEPLKSDSSQAAIDKLRVSSVVAWTGENGEPRSVVLTSELTNWK